MILFEKEMRKEAFDRCECTSCGSTDKDMFSLEAEYTREYEVLCGCSCGNHSILKKKRFQLESYVVMC